MKENSAAPAGAMNSGWPGRLATNDSAVFAPRLAIASPTSTPIIKEMMEGKGIERPSTVAATDETFKKAPESKKKHSEQKALEL